MIQTRRRAAELRDEALFKDPPAKEDCPICFLPMPYQLISCMTLPPATFTSVPIYDYALANKHLSDLDMEHYYSCCGKSICDGCLFSFCESINYAQCPFCKAERDNITDEEEIEQLMKRVEVNDANSMHVLGSYYDLGSAGLLQDREKAIELWKQAAELGSSKAHFQLGPFYDEGGDLKKAKFHYETAAMAGHEGARYNLGHIEYKLGERKRAVKHWMIAASAGHYDAMVNLLIAFKQGLVSRDAVDSTLTAYNTSCAEMRSEARDAWIKTELEDDE
jgi:TPR repeat protein